MYLCGFCFWFLFGFVFLEFVLLILFGLVVLRPAETCRVHRKVILY